MGCVAGSFSFTKDVIPAAEARVKELPFLETAGNPLVVGAMFALNADRLLPFQAKPGQIVVYLFRVFGTTAPRVNILNAEEKTSGTFSGKGESGQG